MFPVVYASTYKNCMPPRESKNRKTTIRKKNKADMRSFLDKQKWHNSQQQTLIQTIKPTNNKYIKMRSENNEIAAWMLSARKNSEHEDNKKKQRRNRKKKQKIKWKQQVPRRRKIAKTKNTLRQCDIRCDQVNCSNYFYYYCMFERGERCLVHLPTNCKHCDCHFERSKNKKKNKTRRNKKPQKDRKGSNEQVVSVYGRNNRQVIRF